MPFRVDHPDVTSRLRLRDYDYSIPGIYFVTICAEDRACLFSEAGGGRLSLFTSGLMIESWWHSIPRRYPSADVMDVVVMPNHVHGLICLGADPGHDAPPSLSRVIGWFKSITTNDYMRGVALDGWPRFPGRLWQEGFYDHIVRTDAALSRIQRYIAANPSSWPHDDLHPDRDRGSARLPARPRRGGPTG